MRVNRAFVTQLREFVSADAAHSPRSTVTQWASSAVRIQFKRRRNRRWPPAESFHRCDTRAISSNGRRRRRLLIGDERT